MNVLFTMHAKSSLDAGVGGATARLSKALQARGHQTKIISMDQCFGSGVLQSLIFPWFVFSKLIFSAHRYEVFDMTSGDGWVYLLYKRIFRFKGFPICISRSHGSEHVLHNTLMSQVDQGLESVSWKYPLYHGGFRLWECAFACRNSDLSLFLNDHDRRHAITEFGLPLIRTAKVRNGIDKSTFSNIVGLLRNAPSIHRIAFIGTYLERKGIRYLREALLKVLPRYPSVSICYFGTGAEEEAVLASFPSELHSQISVVPSFENQALPALLCEFSILAFPSLSEGFGLAPLEAMACGLVPIVADIPGPTEFVINEYNGLTCDARNGDALANCIERLLTEPELWSSLSAHALTTAMKYTWEAVAEETELLYLKALNRRRETN